MAKYFAIFTKALSFWFALKQNDIKRLWNVSLLSIIILKSSLQWLDLTVEAAVTN